MKTWLYQLNGDKWSPNLFRCAIWEGRQWQWNQNEIRPTTGIPTPGDVLLFFYTMGTRDTDGTKASGIYGWGVIDRCEKFDNETMLNFTATAPTNQLKVDPWWDDECEGITTEIRANQAMFATVFEIPEKLIPQIRRGIKRWVYREDDTARVPAGDDKDEEKNLVDLNALALPPEVKRQILAALDAKDEKEREA